LLVLAGSRSRGVKEMANDLFDSLRTYINKVSVNEKSAAEIANSVNAWVRESGEAVKQKIEEEVESTVLRMGFVKRAEFDALAAEVAKLGGKPVVAKSAGTKKSAIKKATAPKKATAKKATAKKSAAKKPVAKKSAAKKSVAKKVSK
jgi:BMFP domain-containing protein YqiC